MKAFSTFVVSEEGRCCFSSFFELWFELGKGSNLTPLVLKHQKRIVNYCLCNDQLDQGG
ncbi:hypothetical protein LguiB_029075 [Lonicera macranthoides]